MNDEPIFDNFFDNFTHSFAAARKLLEKAHSQGNLIEGLVLYASLVDATLRNLVAVSIGRGNRDKLIAELYFDDIPLDRDYFEHNDARRFTERQIFQLALDEKIIDQEIYNSLSELYDFRNRMVHRFIISSVAYGDLAPYLVRYEVIFQGLFEKLKEIEQPDAADVDHRSFWADVLKKIDRGFRGADEGS